MLNQDGHPIDGLFAAGEILGRQLLSGDRFVGVWDLPPGPGNPFTGRSVPSVFVWDAVFDPLGRIGEDGQAVPILAESWSVVDETTWQFSLKDGIQFSNGVPFTADAVVATLEYLMTDNGRASLLGGDVRGIVGVSKIDHMAVARSTSGPDPVLPNRLALVFIVEPGAWEALGPSGFAETPVGTGLIVVDGWGANDVILSANPTSWRASALDTLTMIELPERPARLQALLSGQIDVGFGFSPDNIGQLERNGMVVGASPAPQVMSLSFATEAHPDSPFTEVRARQAANLAVNREIIAEVLLAGLGAPAGQPVTPSAFG